MLKPILGSKTRLHILKLFIFNPKNEYYIREIARLIKTPFYPVRGGLIQLESIGLLKSRISGMQKYYSLNPGHILFPEFKSIILKTVGMGDTIRDAIKDKNDIVTAFIYGSYAKDAENENSDIYLFVVGNISSKDLQESISKIESQTRREISPTVYSVKELKEKYKAKNHFVLSVMKDKKIFLKGDESALRKLVSGR